MVKNFKKSAFILSSIGIAMLLASCEYTKDPYQEWKDAAKNAYKTYYSKPENASKEKEPLFYFDLETLKGAIAYSETEATYLGQINFTNFTFSEAPKKYFCDIGNLDIVLKDTDGDNVPDNFDFGGLISLENNEFKFDTKTFLETPPVILHEITKNGELKTYSQVSKNGEVANFTNVEYYNPQFFYLSDFSINFPEIEAIVGDLFDFSGIDLAILRTDLYQVLGNFTTFPGLETINQIIDLPSLFNNMYKKSVGISNEQSMPESLIYPSSHITSTGSKSILPAPNGIFFSLIYNVLGLDSDQGFLSKIHDVTNIYLEEGIKKVPFSAFEGTLSESGESMSNIKNIYFPSTLQSVQFSSFAKLNLENLYIPKTYLTDEAGNKVSEKAIESIDLGNIEINIGNSLKVGIYPSFGDTSIQNLYFEDYDNLNVNAFNYSATKLRTEEEINQAIKFYHGNYDTTKFDTLSESLANFDTVNPFYQINLTDESGLRKYKLNCDVSVIPSGKKLYLPYFEYSRSLSDSRSNIYYENVSNKSIDVSEENAKITLVLNSDLEVSGTLVLGSQIGLTNSGSGIIAGEFSALNLNGHKLIVKDGGRVEGNGFIFDSTGTSEGIKVLSGGVLSANLTVKDYTNINDIQFKAENKIELFENYSFTNLKTKVVVEDGGKLDTFVTLFAEGFANVNKFTFIGKENALLGIQNGQVEVNSTSIHASEGSVVSYNEVTLLTVRDESAYDDSDIEEYTTSTNGFSLANDSMNSTFDTLIVNSNLRVSNNYLVAKNLIFNEGSKIYSKDQNISVSGHISVNSASANSISMNGVFKTNSTSFTAIMDEVNSSDSSIVSSDYEKTLVVLDNKQTVKSTKVDLKLLNGTNLNEFTSLYHKYDKGFYYLYENSYSKGSLKNTDGTTVASYDNSIKNTWSAYQGGSPIETGVLTSNYTISSFDDGINHYVLKTGANNSKEWSSSIVPHESIPGVYVNDSGDLYIHIFNESAYTEGTIVDDTPIANSIFRAKETGKEYFYYETEPGNFKWCEITSTYDYYYTLKMNYGENTYYTSVINGIYASGIASYNELTHITTKADGTRYAFSANGTSYKYVELKADQEVNWASKQISKGSGNPFIYLDTRVSWAQVDELHAGSCKYGEYYYFLINSKWYMSVSGEAGKNYNPIADATFGVLNERISVDGQKYKFVMKFGNNDEDPYNLMTPSGKVTIRKTDFPELWDSTGLAGDHFIAYRHIQMKGKKYLFYKEKVNESGSIVDKINRYEFEFAEGFTPAEVNLGNTDIFTKFNFIIYKVHLIKNGVKESTVRTIYINVDSSDINNVIYAGDVTDPDRDDYLGLAVFCDDNPISAVTGGISGL